MLLNDIRYAIRGLWQSKGFAIVAILCLGFGIGVNATIFSVMDGVVLKPYPYPDPDRLINVGTQRLKDGDQSGLSYLDYRDWNAASSTTSAIVAARSRNFILTETGKESERL